jgi:hypothetical protein
MLGTENVFSKKARRSMSFVQELGQAEVLTPDGEPLTLAKSWQDQDTVLVFIRHFG